MRDVNKVVFFGPSMLVCPSQDFFREMFYENDQIKQDEVSGTRLKRGRDENTDFC